MIDFLMHPSEDLFSFEIPEPPKCPDLIEAEAILLAKRKQEQDEFFGQQPVQQEIKPARKSPNRKVSGQKRKRGNQRAGPALKKPKQQASESKLEAKRKRNRMLAQQSRDRRKKYVQNLEIKEKELTSKQLELNAKLKASKQENDLLRKELKSSTKKNLVLTLLICVALLIASGQTESIPSQLDQFQMPEMSQLQTEEIMEVIKEQYQVNKTEIAKSLGMALPGPVVDGQIMPALSNLAPAGKSCGPDKSEQLFDQLYCVIQQGYKQIQTRQEKESGDLAVLQN